MSKKKKPLLEVLKNVRCDNVINALNDPTLTTEKAEKINLFLAREGFNSEVLNEDFVRLTAILMTLFSEPNIKIYMGNMSTGVLFKKHLENVRLKPAKDPQRLPYIVMKGKPDVEFPFENCVAVSVLNGNVEGLRYVCKHGKYAMEGIFGIHLDGFWKI